MRLKRVAIGIIISLSVLLVGCGGSNVSVVEDKPIENILDVEDGSDTVDSDSGDNTSIDILSDEELEKKIATLRGKDTEKYILTCLFAGQVTNDTIPYKLLSYEGELVDCRVEFLDGGRYKELLIDADYGREVIDYEKFEVLLNNNLSLIEGVELDITVVLNGSVIGNFIN